MHTNEARQRPAALPPLNTPHARLRVHPQYLESEPLILRRESSPAPSVHIYLDSGALQEAHLGQRGPLLGGVERDVHRGQTGRLCTGWRS